MQGWIIYAISLILAMYLGNLLIHWLIASDYDIHSNFAIFVFCLTFGLSVMSLGLFIFEIMQIEETQTRNLYWFCTLGLIVCLCIYILPGCLIRKLIQNVGKSIYTAIILWLLLFAAYVGFTYYYCKLDFVDLPRHLDFITKIGTVMIGVLSGFGAVYCPWAYFQMVSLDSNIYINALVKKLSNAKKEIVSNIYFILGEIDKAATKLAILNDQEKPQENTSQSLSIWGKIVQFFWGNKSKEVEQREDLKNEINQLREIHKEFFDYYKEYADEEQRFHFSNTLYGKFLKRLAWIVLSYCVYKMIMSLVNLILGRKKSIDPINRILKVILPFFGFTLDEETYNTLSIYGTFIFMGYLMISNVRSFSLNLVNLFNSFMGIALLQKMPSEIMVYFLAEVFGVYLLSTVILLQISLPEKFLMNLKEYTQQTEILGHYSNFDKYFLTSGLISSAVIYFNYRKRKQKLESFEKSSDKR